MTSWRSKASPPSSKMSPDRSHMIPSIAFTTYAINFPLSCEAVPAKLLFQVLFITVWFMFRLLYRYFCFVYVFHWLEVSLCCL